MKNIIEGARLLNRSIYTPTEATYNAYELTLDKGKLIIETPILIICDINELPIDISELYGYEIDYNGTNVEDDSYVISFENGAKIFAQYYLEPSNFGGFINYEPQKKKEKGFTVQLNMY